MLLLKTVVMHITKSFGLSVQNLIYTYIWAWRIQISF